MAMKRTIAILFLSACATATRSSFDFVLAGDSDAHVHSGARVSGSVNNAGFLALADPDLGWSLNMTLDGLAPGDHTATTTITRKIGTPAIFRGSCDVIIDPHETSNGDTVTANFSCKGLASAAGEHVDVPQGEFKTFINDASNDLNLNPPPP
jgi:hypothetical protein